jgi:hypothetical protein
MLLPDPHKKDAPSAPHKAQIILGVGPHGPVLSPLLTFRIGPLSFFHQVITDGQAQGFHRPGAQLGIAELPDATPGAGCYLLDSAWPEAGKVPPGGAAAIFSDDFLTV